MAADFVDEYFKEAYEHELEHGDQISSANDLPATVLTALAGVGYYYLVIFPSWKPSPAVVAFYVMGVVFAALLCAATICLIMAFRPREKAFVAAPSSQMEYIGKLTDYYSTSDDLHDMDKLVEKDFRASLREQYVQAAELNRKLNYEKMKWHVRTKWCVSAAIVMVFLNAWPTYCAQHSSSDVQKVKVESLPPVELRNPTP